MAAPGRIRITTRSEFAIVQDADVVKHMGQEDIAQVAGLDNALAERVVSRPATSHRQVYNITWDPDAEELIIEISETNA